jgi:SPP1 family phage portal protein
MTAFVWEFTTKNTEGKEVKNAWVYTKENVMKLSDASGSFTMDTDEAHGFSKIPIVYVEQKFPEWYDVQEMIDRLEVALSKLGDSNDYTSKPILKIYGDVVGAPDKDDEGKAMQFPAKSVNTEGKLEYGDAEYLESANNPASSKLELDRLEDYIYTITSTPNLSFDNVKGLGNVSGVALKMLFMDAIIKAKSNEPENRTMVERIINVMVSAIVTTLLPNTKNLASNTYFEVQFNSIIPDDLASTIEILTKATESNIMSRKTAVQTLGFVDDVDEELAMIQQTNTTAKEEDPELT